MTTAFGLFSGLIAICLTVGVFFLHKRGFQNRRLIYVLFIFSLLTVLSNGLAVNVRTKGAADLCYEIYYIASNWLLFLLVYHADRKRTQAGKKSFIVVLCEVLCVVDTTFLGINFWLHSIFETQELALRNGGRMFQPLYHTGSFGFFVHILLRCSITFLLFYLYLCLMRGTIRLYRSRYRNVVWLIVFMIVIVTGCRYYECPIDVASILYAVLASVCVYYSFFYVSKGMVAKVLSLLIEDTQQGIVCFDKDCRCIQANDAYKRLYDHESTKEDYERHFAEWRGQRGELREEFYRKEYEVNGEKRYYDVHFNLLQDDKGSVVGSFFSFTDRTESVTEYEMKRYEASHDELTDIYNRKRFLQEVAKLLKEEPDVSRVIVCIDVKDFSVVNSLFGEKTGNQILQRIAGLMRRDASEDTVYARLESDHFAMCMREECFQPEVYWDYLEDLKRIVHSTVYRMHAHIGVYRIVDPSISISVMCDRAFAAIESIKDNYEEIVAYYTDNMGNTDRMEKVMIGEFDRAIAAGEFQMFLQPQISVDGHKVLGAEALVRWEHPVRGMISPAVFIPVFEKSGQITRLDNYMWELACRKLRAWKDQGIDDLHISVNISPKDFYLVDIYNTFTSLVELYGIEPANLKLEITETALMEEISKQFSLLEKLRTYGFQVEIDDFGSGYSSLNTLQDIEVS